MDAELTLEKAMKTIRQREAVHEQQIVLSGREPTNEPGNLTCWILKSNKTEGIQSLLDLPLTSCVVAVVKGHMDVINAQLERQYATDAKRKDTTTHNVTPKWETQCFLRD